jgi:hypothetical protein
VKSGSKAVQLEARTIARVYDPHSRMLDDRHVPEHWRRSAGNDNAPDTIRAGRTVSCASSCFALVGDVTQLGWRSADQCELG